MDVSHQQGIKVKPFKNELIRWVLQGHQVNPIGRLQMYSAHCEQEMENLVKVRIIECACIADLNGSIREEHKDDKKELDKVNVWPLVIVEVVLDSVVVAVRWNDWIMWPSSWSEAKITHYVIIPNLPSSGRTEGLSGLSPSRDGSRIANVML